MSAEDEKTIKNQINQARESGDMLREKVKVEVMDRMNEAYKKLNERQMRERELLNEILKRTNKMEFSYDEKQNEQLASNVVIGFLNWFASIERETIVIHNVMRFYSSRRE